VKSKFLILFSSTFLSLLGYCGECPPLRSLVGLTQALVVILAGRDDAA